MDSTLTVDRPIEKVIEDWDFLEDRIASKFSAFKPAGQNIYGIRRRAISRTGIVDPRKGAFDAFFELGARGIETVRYRPMTVHVTTAGTPHRVPHSMGFWHINDMDELYLPLPNADGEELGHFIVIMQTPTGKESEGWAWYCEKCLTLIFERTYRTGELGFEGMFRAGEKAVRTYNSDVKHRTCPECSFVNPMGYCWNTAKDTPEEREARAIW